MTIATDAETRPLLGENTRHDDRLERCDGEALSLSWRKWTAEKLEAPRTHKIVILLIAIDASCVLADLVYTFLSPQQRDCSNLSSQSPLISAQTQTSEDSQPIWLEVLAHISLAINTLFLLEIPLALWCFGLSFYNPFSFSFSFSSQSEDRDGREDGLDNVESQEGRGTRGKKDKSPTPYAALHLFDALVVLTTFILEVVLRGREAELAGLLVLLRLWRLVKLVGGIAVGAGELQEQLSDELAETQRLLSDERARRAGLEDEVVQLRARLADNGLSIKISSADTQGSGEGGNL